MSLADRTRRRVDILLRELRRDYDEFEVLEKTWEHEPDRYREFVEQAGRGTLGGAGVWVTDDDGAVLLVRNEGDDGWGDPGGKVERDETFEAAARREVREEAGVECELSGVREVHVVEHRRSGADAPPVYDPIVIFDGEYVGGDPRRGEIAGTSGGSRRRRRASCTRRSRRDRIRRRSDAGAHTAGKRGKPGRGTLTLSSRSVRPPVPRASAAGGPGRLRGQRR